MHRGLSPQVTPHVWGKTCGTDARHWSGSSTESLVVLVLQSQ